MVRRGHVRTPEQLRELVREAADQESLILHTLVSHELRRLMLVESRLVGVDAMDLMGPTLDRLATHLDLTPQEKPGLFKQLVEDKSRRWSSPFATTTDNRPTSSEAPRWSS